MSESIQDIIDKLHTGVYAPDSRVNRRGGETAAYSLASYLYYDAGLTPAIALPKMQLTEPVVCCAIEKEYAGIVRTWDRLAALEKRFGPDRDVTF